MITARHLQKARSIFLDAVLIVLISLVMGEIALRIYNHYFPSPIFYTSSYDRFRGKPFTVDWDFKLNSRGFKDEEFSDKMEGIYRILGIGDSFAFGVVPYSHNYLTLLESQLRTGNNNVEVLNMGIPYIGPQDYLSLLVKEGLALHPDMVLLSFFIGNDLIESKKRRLHEYSYVASLFHYIVNIQPNYEGLTFQNATYCDDCPAFPHETYLRIEASRSSIYLVDNKSFFEDLNTALYYLTQIRNICRQRGIKLVVVIVPDELQVNQALFREVTATYYPHVEKPKWNITLPNRTLSNELNQLGIDTIDLYDHFAGSAQRLYRLRDTHWNIAGNKLAANVIEAHIRRYFTHGK